MDRVHQWVYSISKRCFLTVIIAMFLAIGVVVTTVVKFITVTHYPGFHFSYNPLDIVLHANPGTKLSCHVNGKDTIFEGDMKIKWDKDMLLTIDGQFIPNAHDCNFIIPPPP